jgi:hypothetical protein
MQTLYPKSKSENSFTAGWAWWLMVTWEAEEGRIVVGDQPTQKKLSRPHANKQVR